MIKFSENQVKRWKREASKKSDRIPDNISFGLKLKHHLINEMEKEMNKGRSWTNFWEISDITLVMANSEIVRMLMARGTALKNKDY